METQQAMASFSVIVLAAGQGKRTGLPYPKVLHPLCGKPMIRWVIDEIKKLSPSEIVVVVAPSSEKAVKEILGRDAVLAVQESPKGTGHALTCGIATLKSKNGTLLVACGDTPLLIDENFKALLDRHLEKKSAAAILTTLLKNPTGYGRIVRKKNKIAKIVEEKDASPAVKKIKEINTGTYFFQLEKILPSFERLTNQNAQHEYYLTDSIDWLVKKRGKIESFILSDSTAGLGVNTLNEMSTAERLLNDRIKERFMNQGVYMIDPKTVFLDENVTIGEGTALYPNVFIQQGSAVGKNCKIGPAVQIIDSKISDKTAIFNSVVIGSKVGVECSVGPFAFLRPGTVLESNVKVGDFVEVKNSHVGSNSKIPHLSYIGDATIEENVNIGAGAITCNYDGKGKYPTRIRKNAFIGSNTNLVAPVEIGENAVTGAGSVVTKDVGPGTVVAGVPARVLEKGRKNHGGG